MECNFYVGQKVVCVDTWPYATFNLSGPVAGNVYTIREIGLFHPVEPDCICVRLVEIQNRKFTLTLQGQVVEFEACFGAFRFRPLVEKGTETGMAIFKEILITQKVPELT